MKERIVFKTESSIKGRKEIAKINEYVNNFNFDCAFERKVEQVPENFADLLTLCKDTKGCFVLRASDREYIEVPTDLIGYSFTFYQDGQIFADEDVCVKEKATPQQMWNIIKSLIGEE